MPLSTRKTTSMRNRLNTRLRVNPIWPEIFDAVDTVIRTQVTEPRTDLAQIRDPARYHRGEWINAPDGSRVIINHLELRADGSVRAFCQRIDAPDVIEIELPNNLKDRDVLINGARYHGFDYYSDTLSTADYGLLNNWIEYFWPESGTQSYVRFMGFVKHMELFADPLWTTEVGIGGVDDTHPYLETQAGQLKPVWNGGDNYPTSHVQLRYDSVEFNDVDVDDLFRLFYLLAPINLVLERIVGDIDAGVIRLRSSAAGYIGLVETARSDNLDFATSLLDRIGVTSGRIGQVETASLRLPRRRTVPRLDLELVRNEGLRFAVDLGPALIGAQRVTARFTTLSGEPIITVDNTGPRLYEARPGVMAVWIDKSNLPNLPESFNYVISTTSNYFERDTLGGTIKLIGGAVTQGLTIERNFGLCFNLKIIDQAAQPVGLAGRDFYAIFYRNGIEVLRGSTANGRLFVENDILGGAIPLTVLDPNAGPDTYAYRLLWRPSGASSSGWREIFNGPIDFSPYVSIPAVDTDGSQIDVGGPTVGVIETGQLNLHPEQANESDTIVSRDRTLFSPPDISESGRLDANTNLDAAGIELQSRPHAIGPTLRIENAGVLRIKTK